MTNDKKEIIPVEPTQIEEVRAFDPQGDIERATQAANALMKVVERTKPVILNGKKYLTFEHWQTIAKFFNHTVGIEWTKEIPEGYEAKSVVYNSQGIVVGGAEAACMRDEMNWKSKPAFQLRSMAQTRAMAKALRSLFGFVPVLVGLEATPAEEMEMSPSTKSGVKTLSTHSSASDMKPVDTPEPQKHLNSYKIKNPDDPATQKQIEMIHSLAEQKGKIFTPLERLSIAKYSKGEAGSKIDMLLKLKSPDLQAEAETVFGK